MAGRPGISHSDTPSHVQSFFYARRRPPLTTAMATDYRMPSPAEWARHRETIESLYQDMSLAALRKHMEKEHLFFAKSVLDMPYK
jgi:hypothetical protein